MWPGATRAREKHKRRIYMINVIASISVKAGKVPEFLEIFKTNIPKVRAEKGCIEYFPAIDIDSKLPPQAFDKNVVTIIEKWESLEALRNHLKAPHMLAYRDKVKDIVEGLSLKVLTEA
jgi:quinol monooxygenase YgiN